MYLEFFGIRETPFPSVAVPEHFFGFESAQQGLDSLRSIVQRNAGPALVLGPAGIGKSMLLTRLAQQQQHEKLALLLNSSSLSTRKALLQTLLFEIGMTYKNTDEGELRLSLIDFFRHSDQCRSGVLLLVDEAQALPLDLLDELRLLTNIVRDQRTQVQMILAGNSRLEENLADPSMESFGQRVGGRVYLRGMNRDEVNHYIAFHLERVGSPKREIFSAAAVHSIHIATCGIPRLVNQLCDFILVCANEKRTHNVDDHFVQWAWATLQQIPSMAEHCPANHADDTAETERERETELEAVNATSNAEPSAPRRSHPGCSPKTPHSIIEFGTLDDDAPADANTSCQPSASALAATVAAGPSPSMPPHGSTARASISESTDRHFNDFRPADSQTLEASPLKTQRLKANASAASGQHSVSKSPARTASDSNVYVSSEPGIAMESQSPHAPALITFAFQQDIQKPLHERAKDGTPAAANQHPSGDVQRVRSQARVSLEAQVSHEQRIAEMGNTFACIDSALDSLDDDWSTVEKVLAESDLRQSIRSIETNPNRNMAALAGIAAGRASNPDPAELFSDHLYNETHPIEDTQWTRFITVPALDARPSLKVNLQSRGDLPNYGQPDAGPHGAGAVTGSAYGAPINSNGSASRSSKHIPHEPVVPNDDQISTQNVIALLAQRQRSSVAATPVKPNSPLAKPSALGPQPDDRAIIWQSQNISEHHFEHEAHLTTGSPTPALAKRKDLRALMTALRGY